MTVDLLFPDNWHAIKHVINVDEYIARHSSAFNRINLGKMTGYRLIQEIKTAGLITIFLENDTQKHERPQLNKAVSSEVGRQATLLIDEYNRRAQAGLIDEIDEVKMYLGKSIFPGEQESAPPAQVISLQTLEMTGTVDRG